MANRTYHTRNQLIHGYKCRSHPLYPTWADMLSRCMNERDAAYKNYGARGVSVCARWYRFANFAEDMCLRPYDELTLERIDNSKGYSPDNCTWATRSEQCINRRMFSNNTSGVTGVVEINGRFEARFDYERVRYNLGRFSTISAAQSVRHAFVALFFVDRVSALEMVSGERVWCTSKTGIRGITRHKDGGYVARSTINGERVYLGYFKTIDEARHARTRAIEEASR